MRRVDGNQCLPDRESRAGICEPDLHNRLGTLRDQQVAKQIAVAFRHRDRLEVPLAVSSPRRPLTHELMAYLPDPRPAFVRLHHASVAGVPRTRSGAMTAQSVQDVAQEGDDGGYGLGPGPPGEQVSSMIRAWHRHELLDPSGRCRDVLL